MNLSRLLSLILNNVSSNFGFVLLHKMDEIEGNITYNG